MKCSCMEVYGEDPSCVSHGIGTDHWAQGVLDSPLERAQAADRLKLHTELVEALRGVLKQVYRDGAEADAAREALAKADAL